MSLHQLTESVRSKIAGWNDLSSGKIGRFVRLSLEYVLKEDLLSTSELAALTTYEGTQRAIDTYLKKCPLVSVRQFTDANGFIRCWRDPIVVNGVSYYANKEWYEHARQKYLNWLVPILSREHELRQCNDYAETLFAQWELTSGGKIGKFAFAALVHILSRCMLTKSEFAELGTDEGVKRQLGFRMAHCPLFGMREIVDANGYRRSWKEPVDVAGRRVYANQQWYEENRERLKEWLRPILNRNGKYQDMLDGCTHISAEITLNSEGHVEDLRGSPCITSFDEADAYSAALDAWGADATKW